MPAVTVLGAGEARAGRSFQGSAAAGGIQAIAAQQMPASRRNVECQLGDEVQTGEMALLDALGTQRSYASVRPLLLLLAGIGVSMFSSVIPYVTDQLTMAWLPRATFALLLSIFSASATLI